MESSQRQKANISAYTDALGWSSLFNGFAGKDGGRTNPQELLPYPDDVGSGKKNTISKRTAEIFVSLRRQNLLPPKIVGAASSLFEEIARLTER